MNFLRFNELKSHGVPFTRVHIDRLEKDGLFPKRVPIGVRAVAWVEAEIEQWKAERAAARNELPA